MRSPQLLTIIVLILSMNFAFAESPKIGLVLSGGGTKGGAHIGVLKALEEHAIRPDYIAGTSVGAIIGAMYATGMSADEIEHAIGEIDWQDVLVDDPPRSLVPIQLKRGDFDYLIRPKPGFSDGRIKLPLGLAQGQKITRLLRSLLSASAGIHDFDDLAIPFRAVATSLETGEAVILSRGDLARSVRASMSLPALFAPVVIEDQTLVDGGVAANLPIDVVRQMGAEVIIAVDITAPLRSTGEIVSVLGVSQQLVNIMTRRNVAEQIESLGPDDVLIQPEVTGISTLDFASTLDAVEPGLKAAYAQSARLAAYAKQPTGMVDEARPTPTPRSPIVSFLEVQDGSGLTQKGVLARLDVKLGKPFDRRDLDRSISQLYGSGLYQTIDYELIERGGRYGILIDAEEKSWGPDYLQFGLQLEEDFSADTNFNFGLAFIKTRVNALGAQWRTQVDVGERQGVYSELYQPWTYDGRLFSRFRLGYERNILRVFDERDSAIADLRVREVGTSLSLGRQLDRASEIEIEWRTLLGEANNLVGQLELTDDVFDIGEATLSYRYDTLNRTNRPNTGSLLRFSAVGSPQDWGASTDYEQLHGLAMRAFHLPQGQMAITAILGTTIDANAPVQSQFVLGGVGRLSGHPVDRYLGQHIAYLSTNVSWDIASFSIPVYAGFSAEIGNTWNDKFRDGPDDWIASSSIYLGITSVLGPVYVGAGFAEGGVRSFFLSLGNPYAAKPIRPFDEN